MEERRKFLTRRERDNKYEQLLSEAGFELTGFSLRRGELLKRNISYSTLAGVSVH